MSVRGQRISWYRWEWPDSVHKNQWTACTVSVYKPTYDLPFVSVLISIANGGGRVLMRCGSLGEARRRVGIPQEGIERLELAITEARLVLDGIEKDLRLIAGSRTLPEGAQIVNTGTGEILAQAEQIAREYK